MAWKLPENCANLAHRLKEILNSEEFIAKHKSSPSYFTRKRILTFATVFLLLINSLKSALQTELDFFFKAINNKETPDPEVTDSAFCQARMKLKHTAFIELDDYQVAFFYEHFSLRTWHGYRLLAIDGTTFQVENNEEISSHFNGMTFGDETECPMARSSQLYDVLNKLTIDAVLKPYLFGERGNRDSTHETPFPSRYCATGSRLSFFLVLCIDPVKAGSLLRADAPRSMENRQ